MWIRKAALAACGALFCAPLLAQSSGPLTLGEVMRRVVAQHPELELLNLNMEAVQADGARAALGPAYVLHADVENVAGTGARSGVSGAEWTLTLASVLERGGKQAARQALAARRLDAEAPRRAGVQLDLLAEAARRYLQLVGAEHEERIAREDVVSREYMVLVAGERVTAGATPVAVRLAAEVAVVRAQIGVERAVARRSAAWLRLNALWGGAASESVPTTTEDPLQLPQWEQVRELRKLVDRNPELQLLAAEGRVREARLQLALAARAPDVEWRVGMRRLEDSNDWALLAGVSLSLGARERATPEIRVAQAQLESLAFERDASGRHLAAMLAEAQGLFAAASMEVVRTRDDLLPRYDTAIAAAERAFRGGALGPIDWIQLQNERLEAQRAQLGAALVAQLALIEVQRLTAEPLRGSGGMKIGELP